MNADRHHMDDLFRDALSEARLPPRPEVWAGIEARLDGRPQRPAGWWWLGMAVACLVAGASAYPLLEQKGFFREKGAAGKLASTRPPTPAEKPHAPVKLGANSAPQNTLYPVRPGVPTGTELTDASVTPSLLRGENAKALNKAARPGVPNGTEIADATAVTPSLSRGSTSASLNKAVRAAVPTDTATTDASVTPSLSRGSTSTVLISTRQPFAFQPPAQLGGPKPSIHCPVGERLHRTWVAEAYSSLDFPLSRFATGGNALATRMDSMSQPLGGFSAGLRLGRELGSGFWIYGGFQYSQLRQRFTTVSENERRQVQIITIRTIVRSPGDTLRFADTANVWQTGTVVTRSVNTQQMIDLPLLFSYQGGATTGLQWALTAGPVMNFRTWYNGLQVDASNQVVPVKTAQLRRSLGLGAIGMVQLIYPLGTTGFSLSGGPHFRYNFRDYTLEQAGYRARNHQWGVQLGLRYQLNNRHLLRP